METIFASLTRKDPGLQYNRRLVELEDGGVVALDFEPLDMDKVRSYRTLLIHPVVSEQAGPSTGLELSTTLIGQVASRDLKRYAFAP